MKSTKTNKKKQTVNKKTVKCAISGTQIPEGQALCANVKNQNTKHYSIAYQQALETNGITPALANALLTCVVYGATLEINDISLTAYNSDTDTQLYKIYFKNGASLICNGNNAQVKKYFTQLTAYKQAISNITYKNYMQQETAINNINSYVPYVRQKHLYIYGLSYNPDSKKSTVKTW